jgi:hypothetical protein
MTYSNKQLDRLEYLIQDRWVVPDHRETFFNFQKALADIESASELYQFAANYNRDAGSENLKYVVFHPLCDKGTLLLTYYFGRPDFYYKLQKQQKPFIGDQLREFSFLRMIEDMVRMGSFASNGIRFNPTDVGPRHINFLLKEGSELIPTFMREPSEGESIEILKLKH